MLRLLLSPRWLLRHALVLAAGTAMILLGRWQWHRFTGSHGTIQNFGYALEWPVFAAVLAYGWWRLVRDDLRAHRGQADEAPRPVIHGVGALPPALVRRPDPTADAEAEAAADDPEVAAYNEYLAWLNSHPRR